MHLHPGVRYASPGLFSIRPSGTNVDCANDSTADPSTPSASLLSLRMTEHWKIQDDSVLGSLLRRVDFGRAHGQIANAADHAHALGDADRSARVEKIEKIRAFQRQFIG